jgi:TolB-like protein/cytochrome c-type biogenesis protein CcmH/NrfG
MLGKDTEARAEATELFRIVSDWSINGWKQRQGDFWKKQTDVDHFVEGFRRAGLPEKPPLPLPDKPSIAVMPFVNMSDDPKQEYFSDGITENIIMALSKTPKLFVIARNSTFVYKGKPVNVKQAAEDLGVGYILEGSVQKTENRVRITAQLIDAATGMHQWAERYDRELKDIFALQDDITLEIITALQVELTEGEQSRIHRGGTTNLEAFLKILKGREHHYRSKDDLEIAKRMYKEAIALDPTYAAAYYWLAIATDTELLQGWSKSRKKDIEQLFELSEKIFSLDDSSAQAHIVLSRFYAFSGELDRAITEAKKAVDLDPNDAEAYAYGGHTLCLAQRYKQGNEWFKKAMRLNPNPPDWYLLWVGASYQGMGNYEEAIATFKKRISIDQTRYGDFMFCAINLSYAGRHEEAIEMANKAMNLLQQRSQKAQNTQLSHLAEYYRRAGRFKEAIDTSRKLLDNNPKTEYQLRAYITLACAYSALGKEEDSSTAAAEILRIMPDFSIEAFVAKYLWRGMTFNDWFLKHEPDKNLLMDTLRIAGLK